MNVFKTIIALSLFLIFHFIAFSSDIEVKISSDKTTYLEGEMIIINMFFKNTTNKELSINSHCGMLTESNFQFTGNSNAISYIGGISDCFGISYLNFAPNEEKKFNIYLLELYSKFPAAKRGTVSGLIDIGQYSITFETDNMRSNSLAVSIEKPNKEEGIAWENLTTISKYDDVNEYRKYMYQYSNSVYIQQVFMRVMILEGLTTIVDKNTLIDTKWFIDSYPNSPTIYYALYTVGLYFEKENNKSGFKNFLNETITNYPNTTASFLAKEKLKSLD